eukprot:13883690-Ditylum_brightwellii.AAC.1
MPNNGNILPQEKFATLLSLIIAKFPMTMLKEWEGTEKDQYQSIMSGQGLTHRKQQLEKYCPHHRKGD